MPETVNNVLATPLGCPERHPEFYFDDGNLVTLVREFIDSQRPRTFSSFLDRSRILCLMFIDRLLQDIRECFRMFLLFLNLYRDSARRD